MKYSFLVCAYNAEKFLKKCLESLQNQNFDKKKYEIILVNDGSIDKTKEIAERFKNIKIISQENKGLSFARNVAKKHSKGEWLLYVDADDYVSKNYLYEIDKVAKDDINFIKIWEKKERKTSKKDNKVQSNKIDDSVVSRAIKREILRNYNFPSKFKFAIEDWDFYVHNFHKLKIKDISDNKNVFYFYRYNAGSLSKTNKVYKSRFEHALSIFENPKLREKNLKQNIIGHYWEHLYMVGKLWHKDLLPRIIKCKYKTKVRLAIKIQYYIVKIGIFNWIIKKTRKKIDQ